MRSLLRQYKTAALILVLVSFVFGVACDRVNQKPVEEHNSSIARAFEQRLRDVQVEGDGTVTRLLPDDNAGSRHQKFVVRVPSGQTVLIEHNIDLASRIDELKVGDSVSFSGEYVWNQQGGLVHWTHHDPAGKHQAGWIKHAGRVYQ